MKTKIKNLILIAALGAFVICCMIQAPITAPVGTLWSLLPPVAAIVLALITKEVYSSLFTGIVIGASLFAISANTGVEGVITTVVNEGLIANIADKDNAGILIFLVVLGTIVVLINHAGGSKAYGDWAAGKITSKKGANLATFALGCLIFVDDYFNCLTVGAVMRPVTDKFKISRAKLAYIIDATAAPVCIIAPISSWAAAVSGSVEGVNGIQLFIKTIPFNLYALLSIVMVITISVLDFDYGSMKQHEINAENGDLFTTRNTVYEEEDKEFNPKGKIIDLSLPVIVLIICCIVGMIYTGGFFSGKSFMDAFADCSASIGLSIGSIIALILIFIYMLVRKVLTFDQCMGALSDGFKQMVPAILILTFAWTLKTMTGLLDAGSYVSGIVEASTKLQYFLPFILFVFAVALSFATGTSWGTFGILIPIVTNVYAGEIAGVADAAEIPVALIICISACLAGAVCGDHCSPISDTTIMASAGAQCDHVNHVSTQLPYAFTVAAVSAIGYLIAGFFPNVFVVLGGSAVMMIVTLLMIRSITMNR